ncbi:XRE family transcriptional regulator [Romboutsia ilealis]|uniref:Helix-turn-helix transcriptional regulator n=1 Tax=Romboutsia faecis TaxID=2764597 RepID=A0ABR7JTR6_9FIRM|nr:helix-turn-helix transcriptional regulator [Romboutsia faecis]MBC5998305.1 helix-turn-helix transcriptional regulator [Romboutsia faecis]MRN25962.1 XRE family transcriptional regulator [Romboutsia ilealis]
MKERVRLIRKALNMTQKEFANSIGLKSSSAIGNIELGIIELSQRNIDLICRKHNVNENWLKYGEGNMFNKVSIDDEFDLLVGSLYAENDKFKKNIIRAMLKLNDEDWVVIKKFTEELKRGI